MEIEVPFLSVSLMAWPRFGYEWRGKSFGLIRARLVHKMIGFIKVRGLVKGPGAWLQIILSRQGSVCNFFESFWVILERSGVYLRLSYTGRGFICKYTKGGGVSAKRQKSGMFL